jgi:predicted methyltransferase
MNKFNASGKLLGALLAFATAAINVSAEPINPALSQVIEQRSDEDKARDGARHPAETLTFFSVEPGMNVAEALPGGGWYTRILANYLGSDGTLHGVNYPDNMWAMFSWATEDTIKDRVAATKEFPGMVDGYTDNGIRASGFTFNTVPSKVLGRVDRVLMIRALHNLNRFNANTGVRAQALAATYAMLKPGGLVGVVQHRAPANADPAGADGSRGYLKQDDVMAFFDEAGFEFVASSEINANPKDQPGPEDIVWRLPPSLSGSKDNPEQRAAMEAIGESDRMTLLFRKPADKK